MFDEKSELAEVAVATGADSPDVIGGDGGYAVECVIGVRVDGAQDLSESHSFVLADGGAEEGWANTARPAAIASKAIRRKAKRSAEIRNLCNRERLLRARPGVGEGHFGPPISANEGGIGLPGEV